MSTHFPDDDPLAARLRGALSSEADMVQTSDDGLQRIRERTGETRRPWWQHPATLAVAAAAVLGVAVGGLAVSLNGDDDNVVTGGPSHTASPTTTPSDTPSSSPSEPSSSAPPAQMDNVYVYYVMDDPASGPRLYREQQREFTAGNTSNPGLLSLFTNSPVDPDYSSPWPADTKVLDYQASGGTATVDLSDFPRLGAEMENVAVQQVVYTITANDKSVTSVRLLVNGQAPQSGHEDWSQPISRAPMVDVQGLIWLLAPTQGATVSSPVQIDGYGTAFEAQINWEVRKGGPEGPKVAEGYAMGGSMGEFGEFHDTVDLPPGTYEIRAFESSAEDGRPLHIDTKTFTVK
jgi:spore germination protein GerM